MPSAAQFQFGEDTALVAVQHMLEQTVDLFQTIAGMGLSLQNIFALGKVYSNSPSVIKHYETKGVTVIESTLPEPGSFDQYFQRDVERLWQVAAETLTHRSIKRVLVLDDGGICITAYREVLRCYAMRCAVSNKLLWACSCLKRSRHRLAVISWARAAVKLQIGGPIFSQCLIDRFNTEFLRGRVIPLENNSASSVWEALAVPSQIWRRAKARKVLYYDPRLQICRFSDAATSCKSRRIARRVDGPL